MSQDNKTAARDALVANLALTRHTIALQIAVDDLYRAANLTQTMLAALVEGQIDTLPPLGEAGYRQSLVRGILLADTSFDAMLLRLNDLIAAIQKIAAIQLPSPVVSSV